MEGFSRRHQMAYRLWSARAQSSASRERLHGRTRRTPFFHLNSRNPILWRFGGWSMESFGERPSECGALAPPSRRRQAAALLRPAKRSRRDPVNRAALIVSEEKTAIGRESHIADSRDRAPATDTDEEVDCLLRGKVGRRIGRRPLQSGVGPVGVVAVQADEESAFVRRGPTEIALPIETERRVVQRKCLARFCDGRAIGSRLKIRIGNAFLNAAR